MPARRLLVAFILITTATTAQVTDRFDRAVPRHAIKFSPGHLLVNHHPTVELSYEQRIASRLTIQGEYGQIVNINEASYKRPVEHAWDSDRKGYKAKLEARYYVIAIGSGRFTMYTAAELYYNNINYKKQIVTREHYDDTWDAIYEKINRQRVYHEEKGISPKFGFIWNIGPMLVDVNAGLRYRVIHYSRILPVFDQDDDSFYDFKNDETSRNEMGLNVGVRVGYRFPWHRPE
jgi:hypothetical protein